MKRTLVISVIFVYLISACNLLGQVTAGEAPILTVTPADAGAPPPAAAATDTDVPPSPTGWKVESYVEDLEVPWSMVFTSAERMLVAERTGAIREIVQGQLNPEPLYVFQDVRRGGEAGLMGLVADPQYGSDSFIYACYSLPAGSGLTNRIVRLLDKGDALAFDSVILDKLPSARNHAGCRLRFGPDGKLYATIGDALEPSLAQNPDSLAGKILRLNPDGSIPADNPIADSYVYSLGHRNPQGIDWHPLTGWLYSTEHGPSGFDGPPGGDEINLIEPGGNYGWPLVSHDETLAGTIAPLIQFTPAEAPASAQFYDSDVLPMFSGSLFFGALRGEGLVRVVIDGNDPRKIILVEKIVSDVGRVRDVLQGPDGYLYFSTSNRDGRGTVREGDDHICRIVPVFG